MTSNLHGILWALLATALFASVAAMAKVAVQDYHVPQILFFRQIVVFGSTLPSIANAFPTSLTTRHPLLHTVRLFGAFVALACGIWAVATLPLTTAITLGFVQVFFVALLAAIWLGEKIGPQRLIAIVTGFAGVLVIMRPDASDLFNVATLIPLTAAAGASLAVVSVRRLSQTDSTATLLVYQSTVIGLLSGLPLFWLWVTPNLADTLFLLTMGALAAIGQWAGIKALRHAEASVVGNIQYTSLIYATALGYIVFGEIPDSQTLIGAAIIIASSVYLLHRESIAHRVGGTA